METEELILRNWQELDAFALYEMCLDDDLRKSGIHSFDSVVDSLNVIKEWMNNNNFKVIVSKEDDCLAGVIHFGDMNRYDGYVELEYLIL